MKKSTPLIGTMCLVLGLTACWGSTEKETSEDFSVQSAEEKERGSIGASEPEVMENDGIPYGCLVDFDKDSLPAAFANAIESYCRNGIFPDGQSGHIPSRISYAVYDIDGDGQDELIMQDIHTITASMTERIYNYENGVFREELSEYPSLTYYDNDMILAEWSHNQGLAGDRLWPYTLYQYHPETDSYEILGAVDAWDRERADFTNDWGSFPEEIDTDGDGCVYFLLPSDWEGQYSRASIVDGPNYEEWRNQYLSGAGTLEIPYREVEIVMVFPNAAG